MTASALRSGLKTLAALTAHSDFGFPTLFGLNKNYLLRLDTSILSSSVTNTFPSFPQDIPINENNLINSHPKAPAPTKNDLILDNFYTNSNPKILTISSYLLPYGTLLTSYSGKASKHS